MARFAAPRRSEPFRTVHEVKMMTAIGFVLDQTGFEGDLEDISLLKG